MTQEWSSACTDRCSAVPYKQRRTQITLHYRRMVDRLMVTALQPWERITLTPPVGDARIKAENTEMGRPHNLRRRIDGGEEGGVNE